MPACLKKQAFICKIKICKFVFTCHETEYCVAPSCTLENWGVPWVREGCRIVFQMTTHSFLLFWLFSWLLYSLTLTVSSFLYCTRLCFSQPCKLTGMWFFIYIIHFSVVKVPSVEVIEGFELNDKYFLNLFLWFFLKKNLLLGVGGVDSSVVCVSLPGTCNSTSKSETLIVLHLVFYSQSYITALPKMRLMSYCILCFIPRHM
jgi:hypothetical protein